MIEMVNTIKKPCPKCGHKEADIMGALVKIEDGEKVSYNHYRCLNPGRKHIFYVKRKGDKAEQELTEEYIKSKAIKLD